MSYAKSSTKTLESWLSGTTAVAPHAAAAVAAAVQPYKHSMWRAVFETPLNVYDVLIETNQEAVYPRQATLRDKASMRYKNLFMAAAEKEQVTWSPTWTSQRPSKIGTPSTSAMRAPLIFTAIHK